MTNEFFKFIVELSICGMKEGSCMYQEMYTHLFNAMTDALEALAAHNYGQAETLLRQAQLWAEERYLEEADLLE